MTIAIETKPIACRSSYPLAGTPAVCEAPRPWRKTSRGPTHEGVLDFLLSFDFKPDAFAAYMKLAWPAVEAGGGRFLARGNPAQIYDAGLNQRVAIIEFDSVKQAIATHDGAAYQAALKALGDGAERDLRIVEGLG